MPPKVWPYRLAAGFLILGAAVLRLLYLAFDCPLDLAPDEAHYWDWSRNLDWSYYSKGPLVAWLIRLSCELFGGWSRGLTGTDMLAVRVPAVMCGALLLVGVYVLTVQTFRRDGLALGLVAAALTLPLLAAGSTLMTIDAPYTCCWAWALVLGYRAVTTDSVWAWLGAGLLVGVGILAKYTMVLWLPSFGLFLLASPRYWPQLARKGVWLLAGAAALGTLPVILWNVWNDWVTLRHTSGHAGLQETASGLTWLGPLNYLGMQFLLLLGYWFVVWAAAMYRHAPWREPRDEVRYLWWMSAPMFLFFGLFSFKNGGGEPNWPVAAYISGMVLAGAWLATQLQSPRRRYARACAALAFVVAVLGTALTLAVHWTTRLQPVLAQIAGPATADRPLPLRRVDPSCRLRGWQVLAAEVDRVRDDLRRRGIEPVLAGTSWTLPGELGFYCAGQPTVFSLGRAGGDRHSQYDLWRPNPLSDVESFAGRTFIIVGVSATDAIGFDSTEPLREVIYREGEHVIAVWTIMVGHGYRGPSNSVRSETY